MRHKLENNKSPQQDQISNQLLSHWSEAGQLKLLDFYNLSSWNKAGIPSDWRKARIIPT